MDKQQLFEAIIMQIFKIKAQIIQYLNLKIGKNLITA